MIQEFSSTRTSHSLCRATTAFFPQRLLIWMPKLNNAQSRARALLIAATERISCEVYDSTDKKVAAGVAGDNSQELPGGDYRVVVKAGDQRLVAERVAVATGKDAELTVTLKNDQFELEPR